MAKHSPDERPEEGDRLLAELGVGPDASPEDLARFIGRAPTSDQAIARRLGAIPSEPSAAVLQRLARDTADKQVRKEVKRALYRLQQRGIRAPEAPAPSPSPLLAVPLEGRLSPVDGRGDQLVWLLKPRPDGLGHLFAVINDPDGLREIEFNVVTRKALKHARTELKAKHDLELVAADWRYCDFLVHRAFEWARQRQTPMTGDYPAARARILKDPPPADLPPLALERLNATAVRGDETLLARSAELLDEKEFRTWFLGPDEIRPYLDEVSSAQETPLVLNQAQQADRVREILERAVTLQFAGERRASYARRLFEMAYYLSASGRDDPARQGLSVALVLAETERPVHDIPFCVHLVRASLAAWYQMSAQQEAERAKTSLIVTPQQFAAQRRRR